MSRNSRGGRPWVVPPRARVCPDLTSEGKRRPRRRPRCRHPLSGGRRRRARRDGGGRRPAQGRRRSRPRRPTRRRREGPAQPPARRRDRPPRRTRHPRRGWCQRRGVAHLPPRKQEETPLPLATSPPTPPHDDRPGVRALLDHRPAAVSHEQRPRQARAQRGRAGGSGRYRHGVVRVGRGGSACRPAGGGPRAWMVNRAAREQRVGSRDVVRSGASGRRGGGEEGGVAQRGTVCHGGTSDGDARLVVTLTGAACASVVAGGAGGWHRQGREVGRRQRVGESSCSQPDFTPNRPPLGGGRAGGSQPRHALSQSPLSSGFPRPTTTHLRSVVPLCWACFRTRPACAHVSGSRQNLAARHRKKRRAR